MTISYYARISFAKIMRKRNVAGDDVFKETCKHAVISAEKLITINDMHLSVSIRNDFRV